MSVVYAACSNFGVPFVLLPPKVYLPSTISLLVLPSSFTKVPTGIHTNWLPFTLSSPDADTSSITIPCCTVSPESSATLNPPGITTLFPFESVTSVFGAVNSFPVSFAF